MVFTLGIIPARGGSKGVIQKNIALLNGVPLIDYTINAAKYAEELNDVVVSTDCPTILTRATDLNIAHHGLRPHHLASDTAKTIDAVIYELERYEKVNGVKVDRVVLLQPTSPLRRSIDVDLSCRLFSKMNVSSLISCYDAQDVHPRVMYTEKGGLLTSFTEPGELPARRQDFEKVYIRNGAIYIASREEILARKRLVNKNPALYLMPKELSINIDSLNDLKHAELYITTYGLPNDTR
jgi:CMP-N,N'-diacetyllegionaminic acid synthase